MARRGNSVQITSWYMVQPSKKTTYTTAAWPPQQTVFRPKEHERLNCFCISASFLTTSCTHGGKHQISYKPYVIPPKQDHDHKNMSLKRPMSPHLAVYKPTIPSMTSIMQRATGSMLTCYALLMSFGTLFLSNGIDTYICMIQSMNLDSTTVLIIKLLIGFPFTYHYCNGLRYTAFNTVRLLDLKSLYSSANQAIVGGVALDIAFALL